LKLINLEKGVEAIDNIKLINLEDGCRGQLENTHHAWREATATGLSIVRTEYSNSIVTT